MSEAGEGRSKMKVEMSEVSWLARGSNTRQDHALVSMYDLSTCQLHHETQ